jgi:hypothetical protein
MDLNRLINRVKNILLTPKTEWPVIEQEQSTVQQLYLEYILILAAIPAVATLIGFSSKTGMISMLGAKVTYGFSYAISAAISSFIISCLMVFVMAHIIDFLAPNFGGTKNFAQAFKLATYSYTASWVGGIFLIIILLSPVMLLFALYGIYLLYLGLPVLMKCPTDKATSFTAVILVCGIVLGFVLSNIVNRVL